MRLYEFQDYEPLTNKIVTVVDQLRNDIEEEGLVYDWDVDTLLKYFRKYDIILDRNDLYNMIDKPPLNKLITNIKGDEIVFKGKDQIKVGSKPEDENKKIVKTMANKALKK